MARPYAQRPTLKTEQLVLRLTKTTIKQLTDIIASSQFKTTRVAVIEGLIANEHVKLKEKSR